MLGGFGNLNGDMDFWDFDSKSKIGNGKAPCAVKVEWAEDGRHLLIATLNPRLRVNNNFKIFKYTGKQIIKADFSETELYDVSLI